LSEVDGGAEGREEGADALRVSVQVRFERRPPAFVLQKLQRECWTGLLNRTEVWNMRVLGSALRI
jgi:hypothetical protein